ncbi:hypothetical protein V6N12_074866 [Hibiscus sabdariffa]|uniref:Uncharacterized protein n=1 Tax=Hibiscus sabdariffa TaxID=183260 RepID=A0ABR2D2N1_9ROSI
MLFLRKIRLGDWDQKEFFLGCFDRRWCFSTNEGTNRAPPAWMRDYETREGLSEEDNEAYMVMSTTDDPILFEVDVKSENGGEQWMQK